MGELSHTNKPLQPGKLPKGGGKDEQYIQIDCTHYIRKAICDPKGKSFSTELYRVQQGISFAWQGYTFEFSREELLDEVLGVLRISLWAPLIEESVPIHISVTVQVVGPEHFKLVFTRVW